MERPRRVAQSGAAAPIATAVPDYRDREDAVPPSGLQSQSALDQRCNGFVEIFDRHRARVLFAIDVERRRRLDLELLRTPIPHLLDLGEQRLVVDARIEALFGEACLPGDGAQGRKRFL